MYNLTSSQQNIWNLQKYYEGTAISTICGAIYFKDELATEILKKAINHVIEHQSGLRLRFCEVNGMPMQQVPSTNTRRFLSYNFRTRMHCVNMYFNVPKS